MLSRAGIPFSTYLIYTDNDHLICTYNLHIKIVLNVHFSSDSW